jgi:methanethiol S-methyltransferase
MEILSVFYAALGYLALVSAILWGLLFVGDGGMPSLMDGMGTSAPPQTLWVDLALLVFMAALHKSVSYGLTRAVPDGLIPKRFARGTQAWVSGAMLSVIYAFWQPLPQIVWTWLGPLQWITSALFYLGGTLIFIGILAKHLDMFQTSRAQPLHGGILMVVWGASIMTVGHLLLACTVTAYSLLDAGWSLYKGARERGAHAVSLQG